MSLTCFCSSPSLSVGGTPGGRVWSVSCRLNMACSCCRLSVFNTPRCSSMDDNTSRYFAMASTGCVAKGEISKHRLTITDITRSCLSRDCMHRSAKYPSPPLSVFLRLSQTRKMLPFVVRRSDCHLIIIPPTKIK